MKINGWQLFQHKLFKAEFDRLLAQAERIYQASPNTYQNHNTVKLFTRIVQLITKEIPDNPEHDRFNQGNTLGENYRFWKRAKFGRYRLFFRYERTKKVIIYAWINDEKSLRKQGDKNDPYALFVKGLKREKPPSSIEQLLKESEILPPAKRHAD